MTWTNPSELSACCSPRVTQLDLTGPLQVFSFAPDVVIDLVWHDIEPVPTDAGSSILPTRTFADAPQADLLMVPGGNGAFDLMNDEAALAFGRSRARSARPAGHGSSSRQPDPGPESPQPRSPGRRGGDAASDAQRRLRLPSAAGGWMAITAHRHVRIFREATPSSTQKVRSAASSVSSCGMDIQARPMGRPVPMNAGMAPRWSNSS